MLGQFSWAIDERESSAVHHLDEAGLGRIESDVIQALVLSSGFVEQAHRGLGVGYTHSLDEQNLVRDGVELPYRSEGVLKVVEKSKTQDQIETANLSSGKIFRVDRKKLNIGMTPPGFIGVFQTTINPDYLKCTIREEPREISGTATDVQSAAKAGGGASRPQHVIDKILPDFREIPGPIAVKEPILSHQLLSFADDCEL
jgi:hypothetical protein